MSSKVHYAIKQSGVYPVAVYTTKRAANAACKQYKRFAIMRNKPDSFTVEPINIYTDKEEDPNINNIPNVVWASFNSDLKICKFPSDIPETDVPYIFIRTSLFDDTINYAYVMFPVKTVGFTSPIDMDEIITSEAQKVIRILVSHNIFINMLKYMTIPEFEKKYGEVIECKHGCHANKEYFYPLEV